MFHQDSDFISLPKETENTLRFVGYSFLYYRNDVKCHNHTHA